MMSRSWSRNGFILSTEYHAFSPRMLLTTKYLTGKDITGKINKNASLLKPPQRKKALLKLTLAGAPVVTHFFA